MTTLTTVTAQPPPGVQARPDSPTSTTGAGPLAHGLNADGA